MGKISLTNMGIAFITITLLFTSFPYFYGHARNNGYPTTGLNETLFEQFVSQSEVDAYINSTQDKINTETQADKGLFDVIGGLISAALSPVRTILTGANALTTSIGDLSNYLFVDSIFSDYIINVLTFIIGTIFLFSVVLARRDKLE